MKFIKTTRDLFAGYNIKVFFLHTQKNNKIIMGTHFYKFARSTTGTLIYQGKYSMKYFDTQEYGVLFKDTEIENAKDLFNIGKYRTVKSGNIWLKNHLKNKTIC